jgi:hypothetical protein
MATPTIEIVVIGPITPDSSNAAITRAPMDVLIVIQYVEGVTQVVRKVPLLGLENIATMKRSATGSTAAPSGPGAGTGPSGTLVKMLAMRPRVLRCGEFVRDRGQNVTCAAADYANHHETLDRAVDHQALEVPRALDRTAVDLDDDVA